MVPDRKVPVTRKPAGGKAFALEPKGKIPQELHHHQIVVVIDGLGSVITTGIKGDVPIHFPCSVESWKAAADQPGSIVVDVWKDKQANFPPTVAGSITAANQPLLSSAAFNSGTSLGWTKQIKAGDVLRFNVDSVSTVTRVTVTLFLKG